VSPNKLLSRYKIKISRAGFLCDGDVRWRTRRYLAGNLYQLPQEDGR